MHDCPIVHMMRACMYRTIRVFMQDCGSLLSTTTRLDHCRVQRMSRSRTAADGTSADSTLTETAAAEDLGRPTVTPQSVCIARLMQPA
jgi:hypothetical protein